MKNLQHIRILRFPPACVYMSFVCVYEYKTERQFMKSSGLGCVGGNISAEYEDPSECVWC